MRKSLLVALVLPALAFFAAAGNIDNRVNPDGTPVLVPAVRRYEARQGVLPLPAELTVSAPAAADNEAELFLRLAKRYFPDRPARRISEGAFCRFELAKENLPESEEGYTLAVDGKGVTIRARSPRGLFYGVHTLGNLFRNAEKPELGCCAVTDWPEITLRAIYFERVVTADRANLPRLLREFDLMGALKFNAVQLELAEFFPYAKNPFTKRTGKFLPEDVEALKAAAKRNHLEIYPYLKIISHDMWVHAHPRYWQEMAEGIPRESKWASASCPLKPLPREIYRMAIREHVECFKPRFFFIGLDEVAQCPWGECELCRKHTKHDLLRMISHEYTNEVLKYGVQPVIDFDQYYPGLPMEGEKILPELDRRVIVCNWDYAEVIKPERFGYFRKLGFPLLGASSAIRINNLKSMPLAQQKLGITDGIIVTHWGTWRKLDDPMKVTPAGLAGFSDGANYAWNPEAIAPAGQSFDPARETLRIYAPELTVDPAQYRYAALPLDRAFNAKLGREAGFPLTDAALAAKLKAELAATREKFHLATASDGGYFAVKAGAGQGETKSAAVDLGGVRAETLSLLAAAGFPGDTPKKYDRSRLGTLRFTYADGTYEELPLRLTVEMNHWNATESGFSLRFVNRFNDKRGALAGLFAFDWKNPHPERPLASLTLTAAGTYEIPLALFAVSAGNRVAAVAPAAPPDDAAVAARLTEWSRGYYEAAAASERGSRNDTVIFTAASGKIPKNAKIGLTVKAEGRLGKSAVDDPTAPTPGKVMRFDIPRNAEGVKQRQRLVIDIACDFGKIGGEVKTLIFDYKMASGKVISNPACYIGGPVGGPSFSKIPFWERRAEDGRWYTARVQVDRMRHENGELKLAEANRVRLSIFFVPLAEPTTVWFGPVRLSTERANSAPQLRIEKIPAAGDPEMPQVTGISL